ncbi:hypothetical protein PP645_004412 [Vibrio vulnificus]|nr:hypothetical protein [Vibrio vulnificus]
MDINQVLNLVKLNSIIELVENKLNRTVSAAEIIEELGHQDIEYSCPDTVVSLLSDEFVSKLPIIIQKVISEETLIPSGVEVVFEKKKYRVKGEVWVVHKNDVDPFPSSPHAHNYDQNLVIHLGNGRMYRKRDYVATAKKKQFLALRQQIDNVELPPLEIEP